MDENRENQGGSGGECAPNTRETRMQARAIHERWPMSASVRVQVLQRLVNICDPSTPEGATAAPREVISAAKAIISADKLNLEQQKLDQMSGAESPDSIAAIAREMTEAADNHQSEEPPDAR